MEIITKKIFFNEIRKCQKNQKMDVEKNTKNKIIKIQKNVFDQNFTKNEFWGPKLQLSEPPRTRKHQKFVSTITRRYFSPQIQKHTDHF